MIATGASRQVTPEKQKMIDDAMDTWADGVFKKLRDAAARETVFEPGRPIPWDSFEIPDGFVSSCFRQLSVVLLPYSKLDGNGNPITLASGSPAYGFFSPNFAGGMPTVTLPWLVPGSNCLMPYVKKFAARHTLVHEAEHYLDHMSKSAYFPPPDKMRDDHKLAWFDRETEFNALWRQIVVSVRMLLRTISADKLKPVPKMKPALIRAMFTSFEKFPTFRSAIAASMLDKKSGNAIFEFGQTGHFQELARRCLDEHNVYKYHREFEQRLRDLHREVMAWFATYQNPT